MSDTPIVVPGSSADDAIFTAAEDWAGNRPAKKLVVELFVRVAQIASILLIGFGHLGLDECGQPKQAPAGGDASGPAQPV